MPWGDKGNVIKVGVCRQIFIHSRYFYIRLVIYFYDFIQRVGLTEEAARARGFDVATGMADLSFNARAIVVGARQGLIKVVADREIGQVLGVHAAGPGSSEVITVASTIMQAEIPLADLAALVTWHPGVTEGLVEAARRALAGR